MAETVEIVVNTTMTVEQFAKQHGITNLESLYAEGYSDTSIVGAGDTFEIPKAHLSGGESTGKTITIKIDEPKTVDDLATEFSLTTLDSLHAQGFTGSYQLSVGTEIEIPVEHIRGGKPPEMTLPSPPESDHIEDIVPFAYAIDDPNDYVLKTLGDISPEDQRDEQGLVNKDYLIQKFIGTADTHRLQQEVQDILSRNATLIEQLENEFNKQQTLYDVAYQNYTILGELGLSEQMVDDVYAWMNGEDISSWDVDRILRMQHAITPMVDHPDYQGPSYLNILGMEFSAPAHDLIEMFKHIQPVIAGTELPFDPNQATREMYEAYFHTNRANVGTYANVADPDNPLMYELADAHRTALIEKIYIMMTYNDGFANRGVIPTFDEFQQEFVSADGQPIPTEELTTLSMELAVHTYQKQQEEYMALLGGEMGLGPLPENIDPYILETLSDYRYPMGQFDEYPDMTDRELFQHLYFSGLLDTGTLREDLIAQGIDPTWLMGNDFSIATTAASEAIEMSAAYLGATTLDESRQYISAGCAEERRRLLDRLNDEIASMPTEAVLDIEVGTVKQTFVDYHAGELARLNGLTNRVLTYEEDRFESMQEQENLDELPLEIQVAVGAVSDVADVGFILREWYITKDFPAFDSVVTLLPLINYGMRKVIGGGLNFTDMVDFFRQSDEVIAETVSSADISKRFEPSVDANGQYIYRYAPEEMARYNPLAGPEEPDEVYHLFDSVFGSPDDGNIDLNEWFSDNFSGTPIDQLPGDPKYGHVLLSLSGINPEVTGIAITELNVWIERYPFLFERFERIAAVPGGTQYPFDNPKQFWGHAAHIPDPETGEFRYLWLHSDIWKWGHVDEWEGLVDSEMSVMLPGEDILNFQALTAHEVGHALRRWLIRNEIPVDAEIQKRFIDPHAETLQLFTMDSWRQENLNSEIFSELVAASRVLEEVDAGRLDLSLVPASLLQPEVRDMIKDFDNWLASEIASIDN